MAVDSIFSAPIRGEVPFFPSALFQGKIAFAGSSFLSVLVTQPVLFAFGEAPPPGLLQLFVLSFLYVAPKFYFSHSWARFSSTDSLQSPALVFTRSFLSSRCGALQRILIR